MLKRYPHTAKIRVLTEDQGGDGIHSSTETVVDIVGRFEYASSSEKMDYSSKFYCPKLDFGPFELDGQTLELGGRKLLIKHSSIQQTHSEIWLE